MTEQPSSHTEPWVYAGRRTPAKGNKLLHVYYNIDADKRHTLQKQLGYGSIGQVIEVTVLDDDDSFYVSGPDGPRTTDRTHDDPPSVIEWTALDAQAVAERDREAALKKASNSRPIMDLTLQELAGSASSLNRSQRVALLAWLTTEVLYL